MVEGDRVSLDSLSMPLQIRPSRKWAVATFGGVGPGEKPEQYQQGGWGRVIVAADWLGTKGTQGLEPSQLSPDDGHVSE